MLTTSVTRFGNFWSICKNVIFLGNFWSIYLVFTEIINSIWQSFYAFRQFFTVVNDQILKNNLASGHAAVTRNAQVRGREKFLIEPLPGPDTVITPAYLISLSSSHIASHPAENTTNEDDERERERGGDKRFCKTNNCSKMF